MTDSLLTRWLVAGRVKKIFLLATSALVFAVAQPVSAETLVEALSEAYESNPDLASAREQLKSRNEEVPQALSNWRPTVSLSGSTGKQIYNSSLSSSDGSYNNSTPTSGSIAVSQPLYRGGRTVAQVEEAEFQVEAERARLRASEQQVLLNGVLAFMNVWRDESVLQLNINNEQVLQRQLEASQDRFQVGEITRTDVAQSESRLAGATADRISSEGILESSRAVYLEVIGNEPKDLQAPIPFEGGRRAISQRGIARIVRPEPQFDGQRHANQSGQRSGVGLHTGLPEGGCLQPRPASQVQQQPTAVG